MSVRGWDWEVLAHTVLYQRQPLSSPSIAAPRPLQPWLSSHPPASGHSSLHPSAATGFPSVRSSEPGGSYHSNWSVSTCECVPLCESRTCCVVTSSFLVFARIFSVLASLRSNCPAWPVACRC